MSPLIDLMIVGAQKAGTTSLIGLLASSPAVLAHDPGDDFSHFMGEKPAETYDEAFVRAFGAATDGPRIVAAKSAGLWHWEPALGRFEQHNRHAHTTVLLRNPVDRAYSSYWWARRAGFETSKNFEEALDAENERTGTDPFRWRNSAYVGRGLYADQLERLHRYFASDQVHVFLFEDLIDDPHQVGTDLLSALGVVGSEPSRSVPRLNQSSRARSELLARAASSETRLKRLARGALPPRIRRSIAEAIRTGNKKEFKPPPMNPITRGTLVERFQSPNERLAALIGRPLDHWNQ